MNSCYFSNLALEAKEREDEKKALCFLERLVSEINRKRIFSDKIEHPKD